MRRRSGSLATTLSILLFLIFAVRARADKLTLKDGTVLQGTLHA